MDKYVYLLLMLVVAAGCGNQKPVLYPNQTFKTVGETQAQNDIAECQRFAAEHVNSNKSGDVAKSTAIGGGVGAVIGVVGGAVTGNAGRGAAVGAATGATGGLIQGLFKSSEPSPLYKSFVEKCLQEKGYQVAGWQ